MQFSLNFPPLPYATAIPSSLKAVHGGHIRDVWAIPRFSGQVPEIAHWDGETWDWGAYCAWVKGAVDHIQNDVLAVGPQDVWSVGCAVASSGTSSYYTPMALHWAGPTLSSKVPYFALVPVLDYGIRGSLEGVTATPSGAIWAAGHSIFAKPPVVRPFIVRWNGTQLVVAATLKIHHEAQLNDIAAIRDDDIWAVGGARGVSGRYGALTVHFDGQKWLRVANPCGDIGKDSQARAVSASAPHDVWVIGDWQVALHWDGSGWDQVPLPPGIYVRSVHAISSGEAWMAGVKPGAVYGQGTPAIVRWDGSKLVEQPVPTAPGPSSSVTGFQALNGIYVEQGNAIAVGGFEVAGGHSFAVISS